MARLWPSSGTHAVINGTKPMPTTGSLSVWWYPNFDQDDGQRHIVFRADHPGGDSLTVAKWDDNTLFGSWYTGGTPYAPIASAGTYVLTQSAWNHVLWTWDDSANELYLYLNGSEIASHTGSLVTWDTTGRERSIGYWLSYTAHGRLAEFAVFDRVLASGERSGLSLGMNPFRLRPADYLPLWGLSDPEPNLVAGREQGNVNGSVTIAEHAPVVPLFPLQVQMMASVAEVAEDDDEQFIPYLPIRSPIQNVIYDPATVGRG